MLERLRPPVQILHAFVEGDVKAEVGAVELLVPLRQQGLQVIQVVSRSYSHDLVVSNQAASIVPLPHANVLLAERHYAGSQAARPVHARRYGIAVPVALASPVRVDDLLLDGLLRGALLCRQVSHMIVFSTS